MAGTVQARRLAPAILLCLWACGKDAALPQLPPDQVIERILEHCHAARRGQFNDCTFELQAAGQALQYCSLGTANKLRLSEARGRQALVREGIAWTWRLKQTAVEAEGQEQADLLLLADLVPQMFLAPLYEEGEWQRLDAQTLNKVRANGEEWRLEYRRDLFEPTKLSGPSGTVAFLATTSGSTRIPTRMRLDRLGEFTVKVISAGESFGPGIFELPGERSGPRRTIVYGQTPQPKIPEFQKIRPRHWLMVPDPEEWDARKTLCNTSGRMLYAAGQSNAGDPFFFTEEDEDYMVVPYKSDPDRGNETFAPAGEMQIRDVEGHTAAVVYAPRGEFADRIAAGRELLEKFLADESLTAAGPLRVAVNFYSSMNPSDPEDLRRLPLRMELPVAY